MLLRGLMTGGQATAAAPVGGTGIQGIGDSVVGGTSGQVLYVGSGPVLAQSSALTFTVGSGTLSATILKATGLTATRVPFVTTGGVLTDDGGLVFTVGSGTLAATALQATGLTSGRVPVVSTAGLLIDASTLTFAAGVLTATSFKSTALTSGRVPFVTTGGVVTDDAALTFVAGALSATSLTATALTSGRVPFVGTGGLLGGSSAFTFASGALSVTSLTATGLTAGRVPIVSTGGLLADDSDMTFATDTLTVTKIIGSSAITNSTLTSGRLVVSGAAGLQVDFAALSWNSGTSVLTVSGKISGLTQATASGDAVHAGRLITASGSGIAGGGDLTADRTLTLDLTYAAAWTAAHTFTTSTVPGTFTITDGSAATQIEALRIRHQSSVTATAGISAYQSFWTSNGVSGGGTLAEAGRIHGMLRTVTSSAENGVLLFQYNNAGTMANGGHLSAAFLYGASGIGVGTLNATGATTNIWTVQILNNMATYSAAAATQGGHNFSGTVNTSATRAFWIDTPPANTGITTTAERVTRAWGCSNSSGTPSLTSIVQTWANGTVALQRENVWVAPTYLQTSSTNRMTVACHHDFGTSPIITGTTNSIDQARVARFGGNAAVGATVSTSDYVAVELRPSTITYTGSTAVTSTTGVAQIRADIITLSSAAAWPESGTIDVVGAPAITGGGTLAGAYGLLIRAGGMKVTGNEGHFGAAPVGQATGGQNVTNNVTDQSSTNGTIADIVAANVDTTAASLVSVQKALFQIARMLKQDHDQLRALGYLS